MKIHYDGILGSGYWGEKTPKGYKPDWFSFILKIQIKEVTLLRTYLDNSSYWLYDLRNHEFDSISRTRLQYWLLCMPPKEAMKFRLRFPCPNTSTNALKDFVDHEITL